MPQRIQVKVVPRASRNELLPQPDGSYVARVTAPPVEGEANHAVIRLLAEHFGVAPSRVRLVSGTTHRQKVFEIG
ncbi:MAG: DUF167 domain-containing protein [Armatimonadetes bacterium]|nr:DUF167 domain-containing protein [Armatimonadota bacterium]CUU37352.1 hypothetical protein DCOP10_119357 [Armatimonadetes bacterium DC]